MGGHSSLPTPGEHSNSDFSGPPSLFWSAWMELGGEINKVPVLRLNSNSAYCNKIFQLQSCTRSTFCSFSLKHLPSDFPFPMNSLKCIHLNDSSSGMSSLTLVQVINFATAKTWQYPRRSVDIATSKCFFSCGNYFVVIATTR